MLLESTVKMLTNSKAKKDIAKFVDWLKASKIVLRNSSDSDIDMTINEQIVETFAEPKRNKFELFVKHLFEFYDVTSHKYKDVCESFKSTKGTFSVDETIDTSNTYYVDTLENITYISLRQLFGEPNISANSDDKYRYEWKVKGQTSIFSIYDWINEQGEFPDVFHVAMAEENKKELGDLIKYISSKCTVSDVSSEIDELDISIDSIDFTE